MNREVSPPPLKRQRRDHNARVVHHTDEHQIPACLAHAHEGSLRIYAWNINGVSPYIQPYFQRSLDSFFQPSLKQRKRRPTQTDSSSSDNESHNRASFFDPEREEDPGREPEPSLRAVLRRQKWPHFLLLQEVKIKPGDQMTMKAVQMAINDPLPSTALHLQPGSPSHPTDTLPDGGPRYKVYFNLPRDRYNAKGFGGKVYGVATLIRQDFANQYIERVRNVDWDLEGRISVIETKPFPLPLCPSPTAPSDTISPSRKTLKLSLINIYAVNGTSNPYFSPSTGEPTGETRHTHKLSLHTHLLRECNALLSQSYEVILAGDLNIAPSAIDGHPNLRTWPEQHVRNRKDFTTKFLLPTSSPLSNHIQPNFNTKITPFPGLDTFRLLHPLTKQYSYHPGGRGTSKHSFESSCDRVDLMICSQGLGAWIKGAGICESVRDRGRSDHCPVWVEVGVSRGERAGENDEGEEDGAVREGGILREE